VFVSELYSSLLLGDKALWTPLHQLLQTLSHYEQKAFFDAVLRDLSQKYLDAGGAVASLNAENQPMIRGVAALVTGMTQNNSVLEEHLVQWISNATGESARFGLQTRRAVIATLAQSQGKYSILGPVCNPNNPKTSCSTY